MIKNYGKINRIKMIKFKIDTAVRFLKNPKVVPTPIENKRLFLTKKGLTESEVNVALKQADCYVDTSVNNTKTSVDQSIVVTNPVISKELEVKVKTQIVKPTSIWIRVIKWIRNFILAGCLTFTAYKLVVRVCEKDL